MSFSLKNFRLNTDTRWLLIIFLFSLIVRLPNLNRPLANQYDLCTASSLYTLDIWQKGSPLEYGFLSVSNYKGPQNQNLNNFVYQFSRDRQGNYYYLSFPTFYLIFTYYLLKIFHLPLEPLTLQILNILIHFLCLLLILKISRLVFSKGESTVISSIAIFFYTFSPSPLWFHTNIYIMYPFAVPLYLLAAYLFLKALIKHANTAIPVFFVLFFLCYTEWIGFLQCFCFALLSLWLFFKKKSQVFIHLFMAACIAALLAGSLILYQEAWVLGLDKAIQYHTKRYGNRSGSESLSIFLVLFKSLARWLAQGYTGAILILFVTGIAYFRRKIPILTTIAPYKLFFTLLLLPSLAHHLLLRQFTIEHEFSTLIDGLALSFLLGLLITRLIQRESFSFSLKIAVIVLVFAINMTMFFLQHLPGKKSIRGYPYDVAYKIGTTISQRAQPEEAVFITNYHREYDIQMIWYARRNLIYCNGPEEAQIILSKMNVKRGVIFQLDSQYMYNGKIDTVFIIKKAAE